MERTIVLPSVRIEDDLIPHVDDPTARGVIANAPPPDSVVGNVDISQVYEVPPRADLLRSVHKTANLMKPEYREEITIHEVILDVSCSIAACRQLLASMSQGNTVDIGIPRLESRGNLKFIDPRFTSADGTVFTASTLDRAPENVILKYRIYYSQCLQSEQAYRQLKETLTIRDSREALYLLPESTVVTVRIHKNIYLWKIFSRNGCLIASSVR
jgi:hypothetical protein